MPHSVSPARTVGVSPPADRLIVDEDARPAFELVAVRVASLASSACVGWPPLPMT